MKFILILISILWIASVSTSASAEGNVKQVKAEKVQVFAGPTKQITSYLSNPHRFDIVSAIDGHILSIANTGQVLKQGDIILRIDSQQLDIHARELSAQIKRQVIHSEYSQNEYWRLKALSKQQHVPQTDLDALIYQKALADNQKTIFEAQLAQVEDLLNKSVVYAPYDGMLTNREANKGTYVETNTTLGHFIPLKPTEGTAQVPVALVDMLPHSSLVITSQEQQVQVTPTYISQQVDNQSQSVKVRYTLPDPLPNSWRIGQQVTLSIPTTKQAQLAIPRDALVVERDRTYVLKVAKNNTLEKVDITPGRGNTTHVSVSIDSALSVDDYVIVRGETLFKEGTTVEVIHHQSK